MSRSLCVHHDCIDKVKVAVTHNGYPHQRALAHDTGLSLTTVSNFLTGKPVSYATFEELCRKLNLDWREIAVTNEEVTSTPPPQYVQIRKKKQKYQVKTGEQQLIFPHFTDARKN
jgi:transcriptional regulator with XRE-family HTH domain